MTEDEARNLACCGPKLISDGGLVYATSEPTIPTWGAAAPKLGPPRPPAANGLCIASDCMAWRWETAKQSGFCGLTRQ